MTPEEKQGICNDLFFRLTACAIFRGVRGERDEHQALCMAREDVSKAMRAVFGDDALTKAQKSR